MKFPTEDAVRDFLWSMSIILMILCFAVGFVDIIILIGGYFFD